MKNIIETANNQNARYMTITPITRGDVDSVILYRLLATVEHGYVRDNLGPREGMDGPAAFDVLAQKFELDAVYNTIFVSGDAAFHFKSTANITHSPYSQESSLVDGILQAVAYIREVGFDVFYKDNAPKREVKSNRFGGESLKILEDVLSQFSDEHLDEAIKIGRYLPLLTSLHILGGEGDLETIEYKPELRNQVPETFTLLRDSLYGKITTENERALIDGTFFI